MTYYELIFNIFGKDDFEKLLTHTPIQHEPRLDISQGSGFHLRSRGTRGKTKKTN